MNKSDKKYYSYQITQRFIKAMNKIIGSPSREGKVTPKSFSDAVGMASSNINRLRSAKGEHVVTVEAIGRLCDHYKISPFWIIAGVGEFYNDGAIDIIESRIKSLEAAVKKIQKDIKASKEPTLSKVAKSRKRKK